MVYIPIVRISYSRWDDHPQHSEFRPGHNCLFSPEVSYTQEVWFYFATKYLLTTVVLYRGSFQELFPIRFSCRNGIQFLRNSGVRHAGSTRSTLSIRRSHDDLCEMVEIHVSSGSLYGCLQQFWGPPNPARFPSVLERAILSLGSLGGICACQCLEQKCGRSSFVGGTVRKKPG